MGSAARAAGGSGSRQIAATRVAPSDARIAHAAVGLMEVISKLMLLVMAGKALATLTLRSPDRAERDGPHQVMDHFCLRVG